MATIDTNGTPKNSKFEATATCATGSIQVCCARVGSYFCFACQDTRPNFALTVLCVCM